MRWIKNWLKLYLVNLIKNDPDVRQTLVELTLEYNSITVDKDGKILIHWNSRRNNVK